MGEGLAGERLELSRDEAIWLCSIPDEVAREVARKTRELEAVAEQFCGASVAPLGDGSQILSASFYDAAGVFHRPIYRVTELGAVQLPNWDAVDVLRARLRRSTPGGGS